MLHEKRIIPLSNNSNVIFNRTIIHKLLQNSLKNGLQEFNDWEKIENSQLIYEQISVLLF